MTGTGVGLFLGFFWTGMAELEPAGLAVAFAGLALVAYAAVAGGRRPRP